MTKITNLKKLITFTMILLSICIIILPANAITENIHYESGLTSGTVSNILGGQRLIGINDQHWGLKFPQIESWLQIKSIVFAIDYTVAGSPSYPAWQCRDLNIHTSEVPVIYKIGGDIISTGQILFVRHLSSTGALTGGTFAFVFDTPLDTTTTGVQSVSCDYVLTDLNIITRWLMYQSGTTYRTNYCPTLTPFTEPVKIDNGIGYRYSVFDTAFEYDYTDSSKTNIDFSLIRDNTAYQAILTGYSDILIFDDISADDIDLYNIFDIPYNLNITNPVYSGSGAGEFFDYTIPEDVSTTNIAQLTLQVWDGDNPNQLIDHDYLIKRKNETDIWVTQTSGYSPGIKVIELPNNQDYNISITKNDYITVNDLFSLSGNVIKSYNLYQDYGTNYTVLFKIREYELNTYLEGAKVIANGEIKYTPYNGNVAFSDIDGYLTYEISKPEYITVTGNMTVIQNEELFIYLMTEEQGYITPTPTPTIPPDITQPTNLLESIQFAFQKMFGLTSSTEDMETANLFMGLGVIFAGAVLIASITKDALGAVVGGLIGFIMSLALGFIPIWVVFVGFSAFAIYIILTKTGGNA